MREFITLVEGAEAVQAEAVEVTEAQDLVVEGDFPFKDPRTPSAVRYPELAEVSMRLANEVCVKINAEARLVESAMPYKAQFILEEMIKILEERV